MPRSVAWVMFLGHMTPRLTDRPLANGIGCYNI